MRKAIGLSLIGIGLVFSQSVWAETQTSDDGLVWPEKDNGREMTWLAARDYCEYLSFAGADDWRLPSIDELKNAYNSSSLKPLFASKAYWSSTLNEEDPDHAWFVYFNNGGVSYDVRTSKHSVRCVRGEN